MKIKFIKIANILSFGSEEEINFEIGKEKNDLHILIGPNGSGKSNFIEILNQVFNNLLFKQCVFNKNIYSNEASTIEQKKDVLRQENRNVSYLNKNWKNKTERQDIDLSISLGEHDYKNIHFVIDNAERIDKYFLDYSRISPLFSTLLADQDKNAFKKEIKGINTLELNFYRERINGQFNINIKNSSKALDFIKLYLEYFEFIQSIVDINNRENDDKWPPFRNTFTLISCYRNYNRVDQNYSAGDKNESDTRVAIKSEYHNTSTLYSTNNEEPTVFKLFKHTISFQGRELFDGGYFGKVELIDNLYANNELLKNIKHLVKKFLDLDLIIDIQKSSNWNFTFNLKNNKNNIPLENLSAGQKSILHLIFALYTYEIENGLIIIDEPELHLHPQLQKKYLDIIKEESGKRGIQFIIVTHSPVFVNEKTAKNVKRFYLDKTDNSSKVTVPTITEDEGDLIKFLNYTNSSKIFFVDKVILVEGESDDYFYNFYINYLLDNNEIDKTKASWEILNIQGKGNYEKWSSFLKKWKLQASYIGDWDNVLNFDIFTKDNLNKIKEKYRESVIKEVVGSINNKDSQDGKALLVSLLDYLKSPEVKNLDKLKELANYLYDRHTPHRDILDYLNSNNEKQKIDGEIEAKYSSGIFILKCGEIEDYLKISKGLNNVVDYCNDFENKDKTKLEEIEKIIKQIMFNDCY